MPITTRAMQNNPKKEYKEIGIQTTELRDLSNLKPKKEWCYIILNILKEVIDDLPELFVGAGTAIGLEKTAHFILTHVAILDSSISPGDPTQALINLWVILPALIVDILYVITQNIIKHKSTDRSIEKKMHKKLRIALLTITTIQSQQACLKLVTSADALFKYVFGLLNTSKLGTLISASFVGAGAHFLPMAPYPKSMFGQQEPVRRRLTSTRIIKNVVVLLELLAIISVVVISATSITNTNTASTSTDSDFASTAQSSCAYVVGSIAGIVTSGIVQANVAIISGLKKCLYSVVKKTTDCCWSFWVPTTNKKSNKPEIILEDV